MKQFLLLFSVIAAVILSACQAKQGKTTEAKPVVPPLRIEILDPEALELLDTTAVIETIGTGFSWTEGPLYIKDGDYIIFSDIPDNKIIKWKEGLGTSVYLVPAGNTGAPKPNTEQGSNGLTLDPAGNLVLCQHGDRRIARMKAPLNDPKPTFETLADNYKGKKLNSPNDAVYHPNGDLYFTDPPYGLPNGIKDSAKQLEFQGVYRLKPNGKLDLLTSDLKYPNGLAFTPDAKFLYVASSDNENFRWMKYELDTDGLVKAGQVFYEAHEFEGKDMGAPDGMKVNRKGYLFATGPGGVWLFNPSGKLIAKVFTGQKTSNCAFSSDEHVLFMTCDDTVMRLKLKS